MMRLLTDLALVNQGTLSPEVSRAKAVATELVALQYGQLRLFRISVERVLLSVTQRALDRPSGFNRGSMSMSTDKSGRSFDTVYFGFVRLFGYSIRTVRFCSLGMKIQELK